MRKLFTLVTTMALMTMGLVFSFERAEAQCVITDCPSDITVYLSQVDPNACAANVNWTPPVGFAPAPPFFICPPVGPPPFGLTPTTIGQISGSAPNSVFPVGSHVQIYQVGWATGAGWVGSLGPVCSFNVIVVDDVAPTWTAGCPPDQTVGTAAGICSATSAEYTWTNPMGFADNCPGPYTLTQTEGPAFGSDLPKRVTSISYELVDANGNSATCGFTITVEDQAGPTLVCPGDVTVGTDGSVINVTGGPDKYFATANAGDCITDINYTVDLYDNCPVATLDRNVSAEDAAGNIIFTGQVITTYDGLSATVATVESEFKNNFPKGVCSNNYQMTDCGGNTATCSFTVTIVDNEAPTTSVCPPTGMVIGTDGTIITAGAGGSGGGTIGSASAITTDDCASDVSWSQPTWNDNCPESTITYEWTYTSAVGSVAQPVAVDAGVVTTLADGSSYHSSTFPGGAVQPLKGTFEYTYILTDCAGETNECQFTFEVVDNETATNIACPADATIGTDGTLYSGTGFGVDGNGSCAAQYSWDTPAFTDNCPQGTFDMYIASPSGSINSWTNQAPTSQAGSALTTFYYDANKATDLEKGVTTVSFSFTDCSGNLNTDCSFTVTVEDNEDPDFTVCPSDITINTDGSIVGAATDIGGAAGQNLVDCAADVTWTAPVATDNCPEGSAWGVIFDTVDGPTVGGITTFYSAYSPVISSGTGPYMFTMDALTSWTFDKGTTTVYYGFVDCGFDPLAYFGLTGGRSTSPAICSFNVTVLDEGVADEVKFVNCPPSATINTEGNVLLETGGIEEPLRPAFISGVATSMDLTDCASELVWSNPIATDNCPEATMTVSYANNILMATEIASSDSPVPSYSGIVSNDFSILPGANGGNEFIFGPLGNGEIYTKQESTHTFTYTITDCGGNSDVCEFTVVVVDQQDPVFTVCPANVTIGTDGNLIAGDASAFTFDANGVSCDASVSWNAPVATDNCPEATANASYSGASSGTIYDDEDVSNPNGVFVLGNNNSAVIAKGTTVFEYTLDDCGAAYGGLIAPTAPAYCSFSVTIVDNEPPSMTCPTDATIGTDGTLLAGSGDNYTFADGTAGDCGASASWDLNLFDNCPEGELSNAAGPVGTYDLTTSPTASFGENLAKGVSTYTYTLEDCGGLLATCEFSITVLDNEDPVTTVCPGDVTVGTDGVVIAGASTMFGANSDDPLDCSASMTWTAPSFIDNCPEGTLTQWINGTQVNQSILNGSPFTAGAPMTNHIFAKGTSTVSYRLEDCGTANVIGTTTPATCAFTVTVEDNQAPTSSFCPPSVTIGTSQFALLLEGGTAINNARLGDCQGGASWDSPSFIDNCPEGSYTMSVVGPNVNRTGGGLATGSGTAPTNFSTTGDRERMEKGTTNVNYEFTDCGGATATCGFSITVYDDEPVVIISCPADVTVGSDGTVLGGAITGWNLDFSAGCEVAVSYSAPLASDNCPESTVNESYSFISACVDGVNSYGTATATNVFRGSGIGTNLWGPGTMTIDFAIEDCGGFTDECTFSITVLDNVRPVETVYNCPDNGFVDVNARFYSGPGNPLGIIYPDNEPQDCGAYVSWLTPDWVDNCSNMGLCRDDYTGIEYLTPYDTCVIVDPSIDTVAHDLAKGISYARFGASENGTQSYQVTFMYKTRCATTDSMLCTFNIQIGPDQAKPVITDCPASATLPLDDGQCFATATWERPGVSDNCRLASWVVNIAGVITTYDATDPAMKTGGPIESVQVPAGTTVSITYTAFDGANNVSYCQFSFTAEDDNVPPVFTNCPFDGGMIQAYVDVFDCDATVTWAAAVATDNCTPTPLVNITPNITAFDFPLGFTTQRFVATDAAGNTAGCSFIVEVIDNTPPSLACPTDFTVITGAPVCELPVNYPAPTAADNCGPLTITPVITDYFACRPGGGWLPSNAGGPALNDPNFGPVSGTVFPTGYSHATYIEYTATDGTGNTTTCGFTVTVKETDAPDIQCPADATIGTSGAIIVGNAIISSTAHTAGNSLDDCISRVDSDPFTEDALPLSADATYGDACDFGWVPAGCGIAPISHVITDANGSTTYGSRRGSNDPDINHTFIKGTSVIVVTVTDDSGNDDNCSFNVTVVDDERPSIYCPADVTMGTSGSVIAGGSNALATFTGIADTNDDCEADAAYNIAWEDNCPDSYIEIKSAVASGTSPQASSLGDRMWNASSDFRGTYTKGSHTEEYMVTDCGGYTDVCSFTITVIDDEEPEIYCPDDITIGTDGLLISGGGATNVTPIIVALNDNGDYNCSALTTFFIGMHDNCPDATLSSVQTNAYAGPDPFVNGGTDAQPRYKGDYPKGTTTESYMLEDCGGFTTACAFTVTVEDNEYPGITCPPTVTLQNDEGRCSAVVTKILPVIDDNCPLATDAVSYFFNNADLGREPASGWSAWGAADVLVGREFPVGQTDGQFRVIDCGKLISLCDFRIIINDTEYPTITCPADVTIGTGDLDLVQGTNGEIIGGQPPLLGPYDPPVSPAGAAAIPGLGSNEVWGDCEAIVTFDTPLITDNCPYNSGIITGGAPVISYAVDWIRSLGVPDALNVFIDTKKSGDTFDKGDNDVAWMVEDQGSNRVLCEFVVTVIDNEEPFIACPDDATIGTSGNVIAGNTRGMITPTVDADNCEVAGRYVVRGWDNCPDATITADGNNIGVGTSPFTITAGNLTVTTNTYTVTFPKGTTSERFIIEDCGGYSLDCSFNVTVLDDEDPKITCPDNIVVGNDPGVCEADVTVPLPLTFDNCAPVCPTVITNDRTTVADASDIYPVGSTDVTFTVTDEAGNTADCLMNVTVEDRELPVLTCPTGITVATSMGVDMMLGDCGAIVSHEILFGDNCAAALYTYVPATTIDPWINEFHYDNAGGDTGEAVEIAGEAGTDLSAYTLYFYNGSGGAVYRTEFLSGIIPNMSNGFGAVNFALPSNAIQNGSPDGIALVGPSGVLEFISYEGSFMATNGPAVTMFSTDIGVSESGGTSIGSSLQLTGAYPALTWTGPLAHSAGALNSGQSFAATGTPLAMSPATSYIHTQMYAFGSTAHRYILVDDAGNNVSCEFNIEIYDDEAPFITCPDNITDIAVIGECSRQVWWNTPPVWDNCPGLPISSTPPAPVRVDRIFGDFPGAQFPVGTSIIRYRATDGSNNQTECEFTITILDLEPPYLAPCPPSQTLCNTTDACDAPANWQVPSASDNCPRHITIANAILATGATVSANPGMVFPVGVNAVSYINTDASGNTAGCFFDIVVNDCQAPTVNCPADITASTAGGCDAQVAWAAVTSGDNCPGEILTQTCGLTSGSNFPLGVTNNCFDVVDAAGNTAACSFTVTVIDNGVPSVACPGDVVLNNDPGLCSAVFSYVAPNANDNCTGTTATQVSGLPASGGTYPVGVTINKFVIADGNGNTADCTFTVTVNDVMLPTIACPGVVTVNNDPGNCGAFYTFATPAGADNCPAPVVTKVSGFTGSFYAVGGTFPYVYKVTDASGNMATCGFTIEVIDTEGPSFLPCPTDFTITNDPARCGAIATWNVPNASDNCSSGVTVIASHVPGSFFQEGCTEVSYVGTDASGNIGECKFNVCVDDVEFPTVVCPADFTIGSDAGDCGAIVTYSEVYADNCPNPVLSVPTGLGSGSFFPVGITTEVLLVTDASGNETTCLFHIDVRDIEDPVICPVNIARFVQTYASGSEPIISETVNAGLGVFVPFTISQSFLIGDVNVINMKGTHTFMADLDFNLIHPDGTIVNFYDQNCGGDDDFDFGADDDATAAYVCPPNDGGTYLPDNPLSVLNGKPSAGNWQIHIFDNFGGDSGALEGFEIEISQSVQDVVVDAPIGSCAAVVSYAVPVASDNCPGVLVGLLGGNGNGGTFPIGITEERYTALDAAGRISECKFNVVVNDVEDPGITCPADITAFVSATAAGIPGTLTGQTAFNNGQSGVAFNLTNVSGSPVNITEFNPSIDAGTWNLEVWYRPIGISAATPPNPITAAGGWILHETVNGVSGVPAAPFSSVTLSTPINMTNLSTYAICVVISNGTGMNYRTHAAADPSAFTDGNLLITVGPSVGYGCVYPANGSFSPRDYCGAVTYEELTGGAAVSCFSDVTVPLPTTDDCSPVTISNDRNGDPAATGVYPAGTTAVTYTATDSYGNDADCMMNVTVIDNVDPTITCPADIVVANEAGLCEATVTYAVGGDDNCSAVVSQITGMSSGSAFPVGVTTNTFDAVDPSGNNTGCSFTVTVLDTELPVICGAGIPADISASADPAINCAAAITFPTQTGTDNCPNAVTTLASSPTAGLISGSQFPVGVTNMVWTVEDASGNKATCGFAISIVDDIDPTIACPPNMTVSTDQGQCDAVVNYTVPTGVDNCPNPAVTRTAGLGNGATFPLGLTSEAYEVVDGAGNEASCSFTIYVEDTEGPQITCKNVTFILTPSTPPQSVIPTDIYAGGTDNCGTVVPYAVVPFGRFTCADLGNHPVTLEVRDGVGNSSFCAATVTIAGCSPLPVELLYFTGRNEGPVNILDWSTSAEYNSAYFVVEKSLDNVNFEAIGTVPAAGTSLTELTYSLVDPNPVNGANYYRLKMVDLDGSFVESSVVVINVSWKLDISKIIPNPTKGNIDVIFTSDTEGRLVYRMYSMTGQLVKVKEVGATRGINTIHVDLSDVAEGVYHFSIESGNAKVNKRVIKQ